jgi:hypothetical protein
VGVTSAFSVFILGLDPIKPRGEFSKITGCILLY